MVDVTTPPATGATTTPPVLAAEAQKTDAKPKKLTPAELVAEMIRTPAALSAVANGNPNTAQVGQDMQAIVDDYFKGSEAVLATYVDATQKVIEARMKVGLPPDAPADPKAEAAAREKLDKGTRKELEAAEAAQEKAFKSVEAKIGPAAKKDEQDPLGADKKAIKDMAAAYAKPKAESAHAEMVKTTTQELVKTKGGIIFSTVSDRIKAVNDASKDTSDAGKKKLEEAKVALKEAIDKDKRTKNLSPKLRQEILDAIVANSGAAVEMNRKADPLGTGVKDLTEQAKKAAMEELSPKNLLATAVKGTGAEAVINNPLVNMAKKVIPGGNVLG